MDELISLGRLARAHGIKGEIRVEYDAESPELLQLPLFLRAGNTAPRPVTVEGFRFWKDQLIVRLEGVNDRSAAEMMRGYELLIREADLPEPDPDEPYLRDIIGLDIVLNSNGQHLGVLEDVFFPADQEIWVIRADTSPDAGDGVGGHEIFFPAVPEFVTDIDLDAGIIRIAPPLGLLEIYEPTTKPEVERDATSFRKKSRKSRSHTPAN